MPRRRTPTVDLSALIDATGGVITSRQLVDAGVPSASIAYRTRPGGVWQRVLPGVLLTHNGAPTGQQRLTAAVTYAGRGAVLTGPAALRLHGVRAVPGDLRVDVLIPHERRRSSAGYVTTSRTTRLPSPTRIKGHPVAPLARAVVDTCRRTTDLGAVRTLVAEVVQRGLVSVQELGREIREGSMRGSRLPRAVMREIDAGVRSVAEAQAREIIAAAGLPTPSWNTDLYDVSGRFVARPDAWWEEYGVVLEIDSLEWHLSPDAYANTLARHARMTSLGLLVLHVTPGRLRRDPAGVVAEIRATLARGAERARPAVASAA